MLIEACVREAHLVCGQHVAQSPSRDRFKCRSSNCQTRTQGHIKSRAAAGLALRLSREEARYVLRSEKDNRSEEFLSRSQWRIGNFGEHVKAFWAPSKEESSAASGLGTVKLVFGGPCSTGMIEPERK